MLSHRVYVFLGLVRLLTYLYQPKMKKMQERTQCEDLFPCTVCTGVLFSGNDRIHCMFRQNSTAVESVACAFHQGFTGHKLSCALLCSWSLCFVCACLLAFKWSTLAVQSVSTPPNCLSCLLFLHPLGLKTYGASQDFTLLHKNACILTFSRASFFSLFLFKIWSHYVVQCGLKLSLLLPCFLCAGITGMYHCTRHGKFLIFSDIC